MSNTNEIMVIDFREYKCEVYFGRYHDNNNIGIELVASEGDYRGETIVVATVNTDHVTVENIVGIKTWSENQGIVKALMDGGVIEEELLYTVPTGYVLAEYYNLTDKAIEQLEMQEKDL